jgi:hypothetical protein
MMNVLEIASTTVLKRSKSERAEVGGRAKVSHINIIADSGTSDCGDQVKLIGYTPSAH